MDKIPTVLACDVGNTAIHIAVVCGRDVTDRDSMPIGRSAGLGEALLDRWSKMPEPKSIAAGSVNSSGLETLIDAAERVLPRPVMVVGEDLPLPIDTDLDASATTGVDRLCAAAAAFDQLGTACVVADFGTAITIDCVNDEGVFLGGAILPGLEMGSRALATGTAQLPKVAPARPDGVFGKNTAQAVVTGLIASARGALRELVESYATKLGHWPVVVVTGGDAKLICGEPGQSQLVQCCVDDLTLRGVAISYYKSLLK